MKKSELGTYVERIDFQEKKTDRLSMLLKLEDNDLNAAMQWIVHFGLTLPEIWHDGLVNGSFEACSVLTIAFLPRIRSLKFSSENNMSGRLLGSLFKQAFNLPLGGNHTGSLPRYTQLRDACFSLPSLRRSRSRFRDSYSFFYLPALQTLTITQLSSAEGFTWPSTTRKRPSLETLTSLKLVDCEASEYALERILSTKPPLQELLFDYWGTQRDLNRDGYFFSLSNLSFALNHARDTLESLTIAVAPDKTYDEFELYGVSCFNGNTHLTFQDFPRLSHLDVPFVMIQGLNLDLETRSRDQWSHLPPATRHLYLRDDLANYQNDCHNDRRNLKAWLKSVQMLLSDRQAADGQMFADLQRVDMSLGPSVLKESHSVYKADYQSLCKRYGIQGSLELVSEFGCEFF
ncbi:MAG: hypothetical protein Q9164_003046 [Protoblastenia rupestris]